MPLDQWSLAGSIQTYIEPLADDAKLRDKLTDCVDGAEHSQSKSILLLSTKINTVNPRPSMIDDICDDHYFSEQHGHPGSKPHHCLKHGSQPAMDQDYTFSELTARSVQSTGVPLSSFHKTRSLSFDGYIQTGMSADSKQTSTSCRPSVFITEDVTSDSDAGCEFNEGPDALHLTQLHTNAQQTVPHVTSGRLKDTDISLQDADVHQFSSSATKLGDCRGQAGSSELNGDGYIRTDQFLVCAALTPEFDEEMFCDMDDFGYNFQMSETT